MKLLAIDANSILNRAYYGIKGLTNSKGLPTNAIFGFYNIINNLINNNSPDCIVAAFDLKAPTFRHKQYDQYKANRHGMPDTLAVQFPFAKKMLNLFGIYILGQEGFEADDIIGSLANICDQQNCKCIIATGDRDSLQLVGDNVTVQLATNKKTIIYDEEKIIKEYGVKPKELLDVKALMGDASDNIPGVKGIGEKTALMLISKYHNIDNIFNNIKELTIPVRLKKLLTENDAKNMAYLSKSLGKIAIDAPIEKDLSIYKRGEIKYDQFVELLKELEFKKILRKFEDTYGEKSQIKKQNALQTILNPSIDDVKKSIKDMEYIDFYLNGSLYIFGKSDVFEFKNDINTAFSEIISKSKSLKRTTNLKEVYHYCFENNLELYNVVFSCDIASYLIDILEKDHSAPVLAKRYLNSENILKCFSDLCSKLENLLEEKGFVDLFKNIELPLAKVLANMEVIGFAVDRDALDSFGNILSCEITSIQSEIYELAGEEFNIRSVKELGRILFEKLELPTGRKTKNGYSTNAEVLRKLIKYHPIAEKILEYRTLTKLMSTYVIGLIKVIRNDGRVHTFFKQTQTRTGRISSTDPNMQNIPIRTELGSKMRKFFIAKPGYVLIDADYSQIELRILAHLSQDEKMVEAFKNNQDIHNLTASEVFGLDPSNIPSELRRRAKTINFAIIYGISAFSLSKDINVSITQAEKYIDAYFEGYSGVCRYMDDIINEADKTGEVKTMFGRVRPVPELKSTKYSMRSLGERIARNTPIQGTAADIIKIAMIKVNDRFLKEGLDAKLILQVHDELLVEASESDYNKAALVLKEEMENAVSISVPLVADVFVGKTWFDAKN